MSKKRKRHTPQQIVDKGTKKFVKDLERRGWDCIEVDYSATVQ